MYTALTIAGSDSSGGAGIQADIKTMTANRVYAMSAITALTAQNTTGVTDIMEVTPKFLAEQLDSIFTDINPDAIKTGMVSSSELIETIADKLTEYHAKNIVVDPVMVATSGARLISEEGQREFAAWQAEQAHIATKEKQEVPVGELPALLIVCGFLQGASGRAHPVFAFSPLIRDFQPHFSDTPLAHRSKLALHTPAGHCR